MTANKSLADVLSDQVSIYERKQPALAREYEKIVARLSIASAGSGAPRTGDLMPNFRLPDNNGRLRSLAELLETGPLVMSLNRGFWCDFCLHELRALQAINGQVRSLGASIVAITPERQRFANKLRVRCGLEFPVLSDIDNGAALSLGLAIWCGDEVSRIYSDFGIHIAAYQGSPQWLLPIPATFVIAADGTILDSFIDADFRRRMMPEDILAALCTGP